MRVNVTIEEVLKETSDGIEFPIGINVTCARCGHCIFAGGSQIKSLYWAKNEMLDRCPRGETNYYGPPCYDFTYYGGDPLTESIRRHYEQATGEKLAPPLRRPSRPPYGLTPESEWEDLAMAEEL